MKYLRAIYESFGQIRLYHDVIYRWTGAGMAYLLVLAAILSVIVGLQFTLVMKSFNRDELPHIAEQWPQITLTKGEISTTATEPYTITSRQGTALIIIDTTKNEAELGQEEAPLLVGKTFILSKRDDGSVNTTSLEKFKEKTLVLDKQRLVNFFNMISMLPFIMLPMIIIGQWFMLLAQSVAAAVLSYLITAYMPEEYEFETRMRIAAIAITPPLLINRVLELTTPYSMNTWTILILWALHLYVIVIGTRAYNKKYLAADL